MEKLYIVGIGPGSLQEMTRQAFKILQSSDLIVGYTRYNELLKRHFPEKEYFATPMRREQERCEYALKAAESGRKTALVCSGDSGVYGMASLTLELAERRNSPVKIEAVAGVSAVLSAGARLGAPVSGDFAVISLSDLLTPWKMIEKRLQAAAEGDFVIALYNPGSGQRRNHLRRACRIIGRSRKGETLCALAEHIGRAGEKMRILTLSELETAEADMFTTVLIGNSVTKKIHTAAGDRLVTPRGYRLRTTGAAGAVGATGKTGARTGGKKRLLIFGGTTEGRQLAEYACEKGLSVLVCVATEYGEEVLRPHPRLQVDSRGLTEAEIEDMLRQEHFYAVMDATHPYAADITDKIAGACRRTGEKYIRVLRSDAGIDESTEGVERAENVKSGGSTEGICGVPAESDDIFFVSDIREAAELLDREEGRALITTGSKEIGAYASVHRAKERFLFRVLPSHEALDACFSAGFTGKNLICMQGPFSEEANRTLLVDFNAEFLVTKMSGKNGGFSAKISAARSAGAKVIAVRPPQERPGILLREAMDRIDAISAEETAAGENHGKRKSDVRAEAVIVGTGPGDAEMMTEEAVRAVREADVVFGAGRLLRDLRSLSGSRRREENGAMNGSNIARESGINPESRITVEEYRPEKIAEYIGKDIEKYSKKSLKRNRRYAVVVSGDSGFFSGAEKIRRALMSEGISVTVLPGISSVVYFSARTGISWQDAAFVSAHGRALSIASEVRSHRKTFVLTGPDVSSLMKRLTEYGLGGVRVLAGERLSFDDERISEGTAEEFSGRSFDPLTVLLILNPDAQAYVPPGIPDSRMERGRVPMTKREVRAVTMSYLGVREDSIVYDIGAGTGSVTLEAALAARRGHVCAVERNPEAADLIEKNCRKFAADNVTVIRGSAPDVFRAEDGTPAVTAEGENGEKSSFSFPVPDIVFIGGTGGKLGEILDVLRAFGGKSAAGEDGNDSGMKKQVSVPESEQAEAFGRKFSGTEHMTGRRKIRVVINAVTVETAGESFRLLSQYGAENMEAVQISAARTRKAGSYHLMEGQNPVFIISADLVCPDPEQTDRREVPRAGADTEDMDATDGLPGPETDPQKERRNTRDGGKW